VFCSSEVFGIAGLPIGRVEDRLDVEDRGAVDGLQVSDADLVGVDRDDADAVPVRSGFGRSGERVLNTPCTGFVALQEAYEEAVTNGFGPASEPIALRGNKEFMIIDPFFKRK
jgi:hypothetical protein